MNALPADIDFARDKRANPERMNIAMAHLDGRLRALEIPARSLQDLLAQLQAIGLQRIAEALTPVYQELTAITSLGAVFQAESLSTVALAPGLATFIIKANEATNFAPSAWMSAQTSDQTGALAGRLVSYDRDTGTLAMSIQEVFGSGSASSWLISPSSPPLLAAAVVDGGSFDGTSSGAVATIPYLYAGQRAGGDDGGTF